MLKTWFNDMKCKTRPHKCMCKYVYASIFLPVTSLIKAWLMLQKGLVKVRGRSLHI